MARGILREFLFLWESKGTGYGAWYQSTVNSLKNGIRKKLLARTASDVIMSVLPWDHLPMISAVIRLTVTGTGAAIAGHRV
jgi:hypothetical protein